MDRLRDFIDRLLQRGWFAPAGTYDGIASGRPSRWVDRYWYDDAGTRHDRRDRNDPWFRGRFR